MTDLSSIFAWSHVSPSDRLRAEANMQRDKRLANPPVQKDNNRLPAGSPLYYYCRSCTHLAGILDESDFYSRVPHYCTPCQDMKNKGWL